MRFRSSPSTPAAKRHRTIPSSSATNSAQHEKGTSAVSLSAMSDIVSATPRLEPMACAISYSA